MYLVVYVALTDITNSEEAKDIAGFVLIGIICLFMAVNFGYLIF